ncbi:folate-sensitive fragile site protein Fra10Ac1-domain-containing protein [Hysterangium stoloniferum]|nr:folate-sensitive fragile site protein Fra10Ac1-domain-containing protein [Hysterangium stoloniferum]
MSSLYPVKRKAPEIYTSEFDILKSAHRFLRDDKPEATQSWDAQLAKKYEDTLFKEFAVCDLKHYKSGNIALRWRTEDEVISGAGETTCGNTRCPYYDSSNDSKQKPPKLTTMELPFAYTEQGETEMRQVMVKVVLCQRCVKKLMWKREKDKVPRTQGADPLDEISHKQEVKAGREKESKDDDGRERRRKHHRSRSRSPRRHR